MGPEHNENVTWARDDLHSVPIEIVFENGSRILAIPYAQHGTFVVQETEDPELDNVDLTEIL